MQSLINIYNLLIQNLDTKRKLVNNSDIYNISNIVTIHLPPKRSLQTIQMIPQP